MKATIDIKTPAGQSLEGFPLEAEEYSQSKDIEVAISGGCVYVSDSGGNKETVHPKLHKGDTITIRIEEE